MEFIPYARQTVDEDDIKAVVEVLRGVYLTTGPKIAEFEIELAKVCRQKHAVAVSNGTAALHAACYAAGIGECDEVIVSPMTFAASANCVLYCGGTPVFADILPDTYNIDPQDVRAKITPKTKAIIAVHFTGQPCDMYELRTIADEHRLVLIGDAAHALGAEFRGVPVAGLADMSTYSFHPVKHIAMGEGGAVVTDKDAFAEKLRLFRSHGITRDEIRLGTVHAHEPWWYEQLELGYNYRLTDIQAALGYSQLQKLDSFLKRRREIASFYDEAFGSLDGVKIPSQMPGCNSAWHLYVLQIDFQKFKTNRTDFFSRMRDRQIGLQVHYIPVYWHPYYQALGYKKGLCPIAEGIYENIVSLPMYPALSQDDLSRVVEAIKEILG